MSAPNTKRSNRSTGKIASPSCKGTCMHSPRHWSWAPLPTITFIYGVVYTVNPRWVTNLDWMKLFVDPPSMRTSTFLQFTLPVILSVDGTKTLVRAWNEIQGISMAGNSSGVGSTICIGCFGGLDSRNSPWYSSSSSIRKQRIVADWIGIPD